MMVRNLYDDQKNKHGYWEESHLPNFISKGKYNHGCKVGIWVDHYNDKIERSFQYNNGEMEGVQKKFLTNGLISFCDYYHKNIFYGQIYFEYDKICDLIEIGYGDRSLDYLHKEDIY